MERVRIKFGSVDARMLEIFSDMQVMKDALTYYAVGEKGQFARKTLEMTRASFDWIYDKTKNSGID